MPLWLAGTLAVLDDTFQERNTKSNSAALVQTIQCTALRAAARSAPPPPLSYPWLDTFHSTIRLLLFTSISHAGNLCSPHPGSLCNKTKMIYQHNRTKWWFCYLHFLGVFSLFSYDGNIFVAKQSLLWWFCTALIRDRKSVKESGQYGDVFLESDKRKLWLATSTLLTLCLSKDQTTEWAEMWFSAV